MSLRLGFLFLPMVMARELVEAAGREQAYTYRLAHHQWWGVGGRGILHGLCLRRRQLSEI